MKRRKFDPETEKLIKELNEEFDSVPEPNEGRIEELREQIIRGTLNQKVEP